jgi:hypothetical protein
MNNLHGDHVGAIETSTWRSSLSGSGHLGVPSSAPLIRIECLATLGTGFGSGGAWTSGASPDPLGLGLSLGF